MFGLSISASILVFLLGVVVGALAVSLIAFRHVRHHHEG